MYVIHDDQNGGYFAGRKSFPSHEAIRQQLISYHSIDAEDPKALERMTLDELLDYGQWSIELDMDGNMPVRC